MNKKCVNCQITEAKDSTNFCSEVCLTEYMVKEIIFHMKPIGMGKVDGTNN